MRVYKTKEFARLARKAGLVDASLREAIARAERGLVDAALGRFLIKQRVARANEGKSGGFRVIAFHRRGDRAVFLHLFAKNRQATLSVLEESDYRDFAKLLMELSAGSVRRLVEQEEWIEITNEDDHKISK